MGFIIVGNQQSCPRDRLIWASLW